MQVSVKEVDRGRGIFEVQVNLPGTRLKMTVTRAAVANAMPEVIVNQMLPEGGIRRVCDQLVPAGN